MIRNNVLKRTSFVYLFCSIFLLLLSIGILTVWALLFTDIIVVQNARLVYLILIPIFSTVSMFFSWITGKTFLQLRKEGVLTSTEKYEDREKIDSEEVKHGR